MNKLKNLGTAVFILFIFAGFLISPAAAETFDLSYSLTEGGYQLAFDSFNTYKGINFKIDSDISTRYEVLQRVVQPLTSRDNPELVIQDNFVVRGISGSNKFGNLRFLTTDITIKNDEIIYVSDASGAPDSFSLVYGLTGVDKLQPGSYSGRISFILNPIGSSRQPVTKIVEVSVSISDQGQAKAKVEISTSSGYNFITLNSNKDKNQLSANVFFRINSSSNKQFSIIQSFTDPFESEDGTILDEKAVSFAVKNSAPNLLVTGTQVLYTSEMDGSSDKEIVLIYSLGDLSEQKAGRYKSRVQYFWEESGVKTKLDDLEFVIDHERVLDLIVLPQDQKYAVEFRDVKPLEGKTSEVVLEVRNNTGKPYQINQEISSTLVNKEGKEIPPKFFNFYTQDISSKGTLNFLKKQEAKKGSSILFVSDDKGTPAKIRVIYELAIPLEIGPGDYSADVTYSVLEK